MRYQVMMTRYDGYYKMMVAPTDFCISVGDLVKCESLDKVEYREVVMLNDFMTGEQVKELEKLIGYRFERVEEYYSSKAVEWEEEDDERTVADSE